MAAPRGSLHNGQHLPIVLFFDNFRKLGNQGKVAAAHLEQFAGLYPYAVQRKSLCGLAGHNELPRINPGFPCQHDLILCMKRWRLVAETQVNSAPQRLGIQAP